MRRAIPAILIVAALLGGTSFSVPASASTKGELEAAKARLDAAKTRLTELASALDQAESAYALAQDQMAATQAQIDQISARLEALQALLEDRAVEAFTSGGATVDVGALLSSESFSDFSDRLEFVNTIVQQDADLATAAEINRVELTRAEKRLADLSRTRAREAQNLKAQRAAVENELSKLSGLVDELTAKFRREQEALRELQLAQPQPAADAPTGGGGGAPPPPPQGSGPIRVCPVAGPTGFGDGFGSPREGGRVHEGVDLLAPYGTPVVAVDDGNAVINPDSSGGNAVYLYQGSSYTYYAHLSRYGATGRVTTGTVIGYVGSTGNATGNLLHFGYYPNGVATDPYSMLQAVC